MKKIILVLVMALLITVGISGYSYAQTATHQPIAGSKIVGFARIGGTMTFYSMPEYIFTNPNCTNTITINRISILNEKGELVADLTKDSTPSDYFIGDLGPHQVGFVELGKVITELNLGMPSYPSVYTVEVSYKAKGKSLPLQGTVNEYEYTTDGELLKTRVNMVNY